MLHRAAHRSNRLPRSAVIACLGVASLAALADVRTPGKPALSLEAVETTLETPVSVQTPLSQLDAFGKPLPQKELRARWSPGSQRVGLVAGADWSAAPGGAALRPVIGMRADLSQQTRLVYEVRANAPTLPTGLLPDPASANTARWALETKPADNAAKRFTGGLFRVQLSGSSTLLLRPRSGGMTVSWRSQF